MQKLEEKVGRICQSEKDTVSLCKEKGTWTQTPLTKKDSKPLSEHYSIDGPNSKTWE